MLTRRSFLNGTLGAGLLAVGVLAATILGNWIPGSPLERIFSLSKDQTILALTVYGFIASVLPVWHKTSNNGKHDDLQLP